MAVEITDLTGDTPYYFDHTHGHVVIDDPSGNDIVYFTLGSNTSSEGFGEFIRDGFDLLYTSANGVASLRIKNHFNGSPVEYVRYINDGSKSWNDYTLALNSNVNQPYLEIDGASEVIGGTNGDDEVHINGAGQKEIYTGAGNDTVDLNYGGAYVDMGDGDDYLFVKQQGWAGGGDGIDTIHFKGSSQSGVIANLDANATHNGVASGRYSFNAQSGDAGFGGFENIKGTNGDDYLYGGDQNNELYGALGNDWLAGGAGDDRLYGGIGDDVLAGHEGIDHYYGGAGQDLFVSHLEQWHGDTIFDLEEGETIYLSSDSVGIAESNISMNQISAEKYEFTVTRTGLSDVVFTVYSKAVINGFSVTVKQPTEAGNYVQTILSFDTTPAIEGAGNINGTSADDLIIGSEANDGIRAYDGNDVIYAGSGNDYIDPGAGNDYVALFANDAVSTSQIADSHGGHVVMGQGNDIIDFKRGEWAWLNYETGTQSAYINFTNASYTFNDGQVNAEVVGAYQAIDSYGDTDSFINLGDGNHNGAHFWGGDYDDQFVTDRHVWWEATKGHDEVIFDITKGGWVAASWDNQAVQWDLNQGELEHKFIGEAEEGAAHSITITNVNNLAGRNGDDTLIGNDSNNTLIGGDGEDTLYGGLGNDALLGGAGGDKLYGGAGDDRLYNSNWVSSGKPDNEGVNELVGGAGDDRYFIDTRLVGSTKVVDASGVSDKVYFIDYENRDNKQAYIDQSTGDFVFESLNGHKVTIESDASGSLGIEKIGWTSSGYNDVPAYTTDLDLVSDLSNVTDGHNWVVGSLGNDTIIINSHAGLTSSSLVPDFEYLVTANSGDDVITVNSVLRGWVSGGDGNDTITANTGTKAYFNADAGDDVLIGADQNDELIGNSGNDVLTGAGGNDYLSGGSGNDTYVFDINSGHDTIVDRAGIDTLRFDLYNANDGGTYIRDGNDFIYQKNDGTAGFTIEDHFAGKAVEKLVYTSTGSDWWAPSMSYNLRANTELTNDQEIVVGTEGNDVISSTKFSGTHDLIYAGSGDDVITTSGHHMVTAGSGDDTLSIDALGWIDGGDGVDTLVIDSPDSVTVNLSTNDESVAWGVAGQEYTFVGAGYNKSVSRFENVTAGVGDDILQGDEQANILRGEAGADQLHGGAGNDKLVGRDGDDLLKGGAGSDILNGGSGSDTFRDNLADFNGDVIFMEDVGDQLIIQDSSLTISDVTVSEARAGLYNFVIDDGVAAPVAFIVHAKQGYVGLELSSYNNDTGTVIRITPDDGVNTIIGSSDDEVLVGTSGDDDVHGKAGDDKIYTYAGNDRIIASDGMAGEEIFDGAGDDFIQLAHYSDNPVDWSGGRYHASPGNDTIDFGSSNWAWVHYHDNVDNFDTANGEAVISDSMGALINFTSSDQQIDGVTVASYTVRDNWGYTDTYIGSEAVLEGHFTGSEHDDHMISDGNHWWTISEGNDSFIGGADAGSTLSASYVGDLQDLNWSLVESGSSTVSYRWLGDTTDSVLTYENVSHIFAGVGNDSLTGNASSNQLYGFDGDDTLHGMAGNDELFGGEGNDTLLGGEGDDRLYNRQQHHDDTRNVDYGVDVMNGGLGNDIYYISGYSTTGSVTISDDGGVDTLYVEDTLGRDAGDFYINGSGDLVYETNLGHKTIIGKDASGSFVIEKIGWYASGKSGVSAYSNVHDIVTDLTDIRDLNSVIAGTHEDDSIVVHEDEYRANDGGYEIYANAGDDIISVATTRSGWIYAGIGNDTVSIQEGGSGNVTGDAGNDKLIGGSHGDYFNGGNDNDVLIGNGGDDNLHGGAGNDHLIGGDGNDNLEGHDGSNRLSGGNGNDVIISMGDADYLVGDAGDDVFQLSSDGQWTGHYNARNVDMGDSVGTQEKVGLGGKLRYSQSIDGGSNFDVLELSGGDDAFFLDDVYSGFYIELGESAVARVINLEAIKSGEGNDIIDLTSSNFSLSNDTEIDAGDGDDVIWAASGDDFINGGDGSDILFGSAGADVVVGGTGADNFQFTATSDIDVLLDFVASSGDELHFYARSGYSSSSADLSLSNGVLTWDTGDNGNIVTVDMSATMDSSDISQLLGSIQFIDIV